MSSLFDGWMWQPPPHWTRITSVDMHCGGEPLRVITGGLPALDGRTVLEKRRCFRDRYDHLRTALMWEPRGHADMYGAVLTPSIDADFDVFFLHNEGYSTMCGHAILALTTLVFETGLIAKPGDARHLAINAPAGRVHARADMTGPKVARASFVNVPSFVSASGCQVDVPGIGSVSYDISYGGAFYALVDAAPLGLELVPTQVSRIIDYGRRIKHAVMDAGPVTHPSEPDLSFLYGTIFTDRAQTPGHHSRNVCVFADGEVDRSSTGTGVSARAAQLHARGELAIGETITIESIVGSTMSVAATEQTTFGRHSAVVPEVSGTASITGRHEFLIDPDDPFRTGFILR
jgi:trans-L-3-hydroxyproline dehydratase